MCDVIQFTYLILFVLIRSQSSQVKIKLHTEVTELTNRTCKT